MWNLVLVSKFATSALTSGSRRSESLSIGFKSVIYANCNKLAEKW
jgi:hypothetical protein